MRQITKRVKGGQETTFVCSKCGDFIHSMFISEGKRCEYDWSKVPEKCSCGAILTNRQPIIDIGGEDTYTTDVDGIHESEYTNDENVHINDENVHRNAGDIRKNTYGSHGTREEYIRDIEDAISIDYFEIRLNSFKRSNFKIPDNVDDLRLECIKRNISYIESSLKQLSHKYDTDSKNDMQERLSMLIQKHDDLLEKLEDKKDVDKKDIDKKRY